MNLGPLNTFANLTHMMSTDKMHFSSIVIQYMCSVILLIYCLALVAMSSYMISVNMDNGQKTLICFIIIFMLEWYVRITYNSVVLIIIYFMDCYCLMLILMYETGCSVLPLTWRWPQLTPDWCCVMQLNLFAFS